MAMSEDLGGRLHAQAYTCAFFWQLAEFSWMARGENSNHFMVSLMSFRGERIGSGLLGNLNPKSIKHHLWVVAVVSSSFHR